MFLTWGAGNVEFADDEVDSSASTREMLSRTLSITELGLRPKYRRRTLIIRRKARERGVFFFSPFLLLRDH